MRTIIYFLVITLFTFGLVINEASAKRFGGGRSFGTYRSANSYSAPKQNFNTMGKANNKSRWGGMLGGLLVGGLLASLFMGNGFASGMLSWLIIGVLVLVCVNLFRRKNQPSYQSASNHAAYNQPNSNSNSMDFKAFTNLSNSSSSSNSSSLNIDEAGFLRDAKVKFIRLQEAYDKKNLDDISTFTMPEIFAEIKIQFEERENDYNHTDVVKLDAKLLDASTEENSQLASVLFSGVIKEENNAAESFEEVWHFKKEADENNWKVSGVQQQRPL